MMQEKFLKPEFVIWAKIRMLCPSNIKKCLIRKSFIKPEMPEFFSSSGHFDNIYFFFNIYTDICHISTNSGHLVGLGGLAPANSTTDTETHPLGYDEPYGQPHFWSYKHQKVFHH